MRAIIIPLNEFFYNFEKYDGKNEPDRFWEKHPKLHKLCSTKLFQNYFLIPIVAPFGIIYFGSIYIWYKIKYGKPAAMQKMDAVFDNSMKCIERLKFFQRKNILPAIKKMELQNYSLLIYYNSSMIPREEKKQKAFYEKLERMKRNLDITHVMNANSKEDIDSVLKVFDINVSESFFMTDGNIDLDNYPMLEMQC